MNLFQPKVIQNALAHMDRRIPEQHAAILQAWRDSVTSKAIFTQKETALHGHFIQKILMDVLGYAGFGEAAAWNLQREQHIGQGRVDVALGCFTNAASHVLAPFELKGAKTKDLDAIMPGRHKSPVQQAWEYAMDAPGAKWVLVSNYLEIRLYAVGYGKQAYERWQLAELLDPPAYLRFTLLLAAANLLTGRTGSLLQESAQIEKSITHALYRDYKALRATLLATLKQDHPALPELARIAYAQTILDRLLFIAFAEDKGLLPANTLAQAYQHRDPYHPRPIWENFQGLFRAINQGSPELKIPAYNGGLFRFADLPEALGVRDDVCRAFKELGDYDFASEVSVTILGHIFEQSITDLEALQAQAKGEPPPAAGKRKKEGVVYTPDLITRFIVEKALGGYLAAQFHALLAQFAAQRKHRGVHAGAWKSAKAEIAFWRAYQQILRQAKVLDPACGSGAFLVAAFDYLHDEYTRVNRKLEELGGQPELFELDKEILNQNLYGVDINAESIEITKLSLWLKTAKHGKVLNSLDHNLRVGDSLMNSPPGRGQGWVNELLDIPQPTPIPSQEGNLPTPAPSQEGNICAFRWQTAFPEVFAQGGFDVVIGNPPYVRQELIAPRKPFLQAQYAVYHGVADLYTYFFECGLRLLKPGGKLGYISSGTFFKTGSGQNLRGYLTERATLESIVDFGDVQVFEGVTTYPAILILANTPPAPQHALRFLKLTAAPAEDLSKTFNAQAATMPQASLTGESWRLENDALARLRQKITAGKKTLKEVYGLPLSGVKTGLNEAFVIDHEIRDAILSAEPRSEEMIKPFWEGKDLKRWHVESRDLWLIWFPRGWTFEYAGLKNETEAWQWLKEHYPAIVTHLEPFIEKARKRWDKGDFWWELRTCAYYEKFEKSKIVYLDIAHNSPFSMDQSSNYLANTAYFIPSGDWFLLGLLNSKILWFYWEGISTTIRGGFIRLIQQNLERTPIPDATDAQKAAIADLAQRCQSTAEARYQLQEAVRRRLPDLCPAGRKPKLSIKLTAWWTLDFAAFRAEIKKCFKADIPLTERNEWDHFLAAERAKVVELSRTLTQLEADLNQQVYALFDLTAEEIGMIAQAIRSEE